MAQSDYKPHDYQDELDTEGVDRVTDELTDHPADSMQVPEDERADFEEEYADELNKLDIEGDSRSGDDDEREYVEDMDQDRQ